MHFCAFLAAAALLGAEVPPPAAALKMMGLIDSLQHAQRVKFRLSEAELNQYLSFALKRTPRPGLSSVSIKLFPNNYISTFTVVDFDAVERWKPGTIPSLLRPVLSGKREIWVDYRFQARNGSATFSVEKAYFGSIRLPAFFVEKMIGIVAARQPEKYDTSKPLPLPFGLREVRTEPHAVMGEN